MMHRTLALLFATACVAQLHAQDVTRPTTIEIGHEGSRLNNGSPHWRETSAQVQHRLGKESYAALGVLSTRRFGLADTQINGAFSAPLARRLIGTVEGSYSDTHRVLAKRSVGFSAQYEFAPAWLAHAGVRNTRYDAVSVNQGSLGLERYISNFSWNATWYPVRAFGQTANSFALRGNYYYQDYSYVGLIAATGEETTAVGANNVVVADVRSLALTGRHWLSQQWAVTYALSRTRQGSFYTRDGARIGAQYAF